MAEYELRAVGRKGPNYPPSHAYLCLCLPSHSFTVRERASQREMAGEIPVVDLSRFAPAEVRKLVAACQGPGCFRVVGHGVPPELRAEMKAAVRSLFDLPADAKRRNGDVIPGSGYMAPSPTNPLYEAFGLVDAADPADVDAFFSSLQLSLPHHREIFKLYAYKIHELVLDIANKIAESLGVVDYPFKEWPCQFRMNKYHFTDQTLGASGVQIHTDSGFLTILQEDDSVGGLEIMDQSGKFVAVDPVPGSYLVNLGDIAKVWSNGRLHNVKHRVQCKEAATRISIAVFLLGPKHDAVEPPAELLDAMHPRLYRQITMEEFRKLRFSSGSQAGEALSLLALQETSTAA